MSLFSSSLKGIVSLFFGFFVGSLISLLIFPSLQRISSQLCFSSTNEKFEKIVYSQHVSQENDDFDPNIIQTSSPKSNQGKINSKLKLVRPRFYATELGVKDKLCVSVIVGGGNLSLIAAINKTVAHHVNRLLFFDSNSDSTTFRRNGSFSLSLIGSSRPQKDKTNEFYFVLNHVTEHYLNNYDWFYFVRDSTYVKAFKLFEFVTHLSTGYDVVMGKRYTNFCSLNNGLLLSNGALKKIVQHLSKCATDESVINNDDDGDPGSNFENCLKKYANLKCNEEWNGKTYKSFDLPLNVELDRDLSALFGAKDNLNQLLTVSNVRNAADIYRLHKHFCNIELDQINQLMSNIEDGILNSSFSFSEEITWPASLPKSMRPKNRYEAFRWDYFTPSEIFEIANDRNVRPLDGLNKLDVDDLLEFVSQKIRRIPKYADLRLVDLEGGYRKFDPSRGIDYILNLKFLNTKNSSTEIRKSIRLLRPLSRAEIAPVPYVTEASRVNAILPLTADDEQITPAHQFLTDYIHSCLETDENSRLIIVFLFTNLDERNRFRPLIDRIDLWKRKYAKQGDVRISYYYMQQSTHDNVWLDSVSFAVRLLGADQLFLLVSPWTDLRADFLNRVRMNTIQSFQAFFPVPFVRYHPKFVRSSIDRLEVNKWTGRFDTDDYSIASFYGNDFLIRRDYELGNRSLSAASNNVIDLIDLFVGSDLHIMRAVDPSLIVNYNNKVCDKNLNSENYANCTLSKKERFASKSQLAALILERGLL